MTDPRPGARPRTLRLGGRADGTIATLAVCAWLGARVFRVHDVPATREALAAVADLRAAAVRER